MAVYQRGESWYIDISINKKRIRRVIGEARTKRQALRAERILRDEIFENRYGIGGQKVFKDFVEDSYKPYARDSKKGYSVEKSVLKVLLKEFGKQKLFEITPEQIEKFKRQRVSETTRRGGKRSKATVNRDVAVLSAVFNLAKDYGEIKENPVNNVKYYTNLPSRTRVLSEFEERILFKEINDNVIFSRQIEILLYTGMRRGELFKLQWQDIDFEDEIITLRPEITKTGKGRIVGMLSNVKAIFQNIKDETENFEKTTRIFSGAKSRAGAFSIKFREVCSKLGWDDLTVHSLRHTFRTRANKYKIDPFAQKALLGHSKLSMTDRYTHLSKETIKESMKPFEEHLTKVKNSQ